MEITEDIIIKLREFAISKDDGITYLLALYYGYNPSYIPESISSRMNRTGIYVKDETSNTLDWKVPLFDGQDTNFSWVSLEWIPLFENVNPKRKGIKKTAIARMKKFFANYPQYRQDDVMSATKMYLNNLQNADYLITSHYFIQKGKGIEKTEPLLEWCEKYDRVKQYDKIQRDKTNTMKE